MSEEAFLEGVLFAAVILIVFGVVVILSPSKEDIRLSPAEWECTKSHRLKLETCEQWTRKESK